MTKTSKPQDIKHAGFRCTECGRLDAHSNQPCMEHDAVENVYRMTKTSKQPDESNAYRFTGNEHGVMTRVETEVLGIEFVDGVVEATVKIGVSAPMKIRFTYRQAREHDIIEEVE